jgi:hypothetical protein
MLDLNRHDVVAISAAKGLQLRQCSQPRRDAHEPHRAAALGAVASTFNDGSIRRCF